MPSEPFTFTLAERTRIASINAFLYKLTPREHDVLAGIVRGLSAKEIARVLSISPRTVEAHRQNLLHKTQARNAVELAWIVGCLWSFEFRDDKGVKASPFAVGRPERQRVSANQ
jgi:DNA-binding CsgD family transcriptional regulator